MTNIDLLNSSVVFPEAMRIVTPYNGFTRYLMQNKIGADYMESNMSKNFIFYEPINQKTFKIFSNCKDDRESIIKAWNPYVQDNALYVCQNVEFINEKHQKEIDDIFSIPNDELSIFLQSIADSIIDQNKEFDICIGVVHGEQLANDGVRYPHAHILLKTKIN